MYSKSVFLYSAMFTRADKIKFALPNRLAWILFLAHTISLHSSQNAVCDTLPKELAKLLHLSGRSMCRMTNAVSWDSVQNLCLAIKSMFSTTSCVCNLGSPKIHLFLLNEAWYMLWLKFAVTCFSNTRFTCKIISALYISHINQSRDSGFVATATWNRSSPSFLSVVTSPSSTKTSVA